MLLYEGINSLLIEVGKDLDKALCIVTQCTVNQLSTGSHVTPLVVTTQLETHAILLILIEEGEVLHPVVVVHQLRLVRLIAIEVEELRYLLLDSFLIMIESL